MEEIVPVIIIDCCAPQQKQIQREPPMLANCGWHRCAHQHNSHSSGQHLQQRLSVPRDGESSFQMTRRRLLLLGTSLSVPDPLTTILWELAVSFIVSCSGEDLLCVATPPPTTTTHPPADDCPTVGGISAAEQPVHLSWMDTKKGRQNCTNSVVLPRHRRGGNFSLLCLDFWPAWCSCICVATLLHRESPGGLSLFVPKSRVDHLGCGASRPRASVLRTTKL